MKVVSPAVRAPTQPLGSLMRWTLIVLLLLQRVFQGSSYALPECVLQNASDLTEGDSGFDDATCSSPNWIYSDFESAEYKSAVSKVLDGMRNERYKHLCDSRWNKLKVLLLENTSVLYIDGAKPTTISPKYQFDVKFKPGAKPVRANLPRYSPPQAERERHHVLKEQNLGHLRIPESHQLSEWVTKTHIVHKKDDELGRWICDFRALNAALEKRGITIGDCHDKVRALCKALWKSGFDCWSGFNQMQATEAARRAMTIATSLGLRQWCVMPFGVCNGPAVFHGAMLDIFGDLMFGTGEEGEALKALDAMVEFFMDDGAVGTGDCSEASLEADGKSDVFFDRHLEALQIVFTRAKSVNLRLKLTKCFFVQYELGLLGMLVGRGNMSTDPSKILALQSWPRPSRPEDVEKFLCSFGYIRQFITPKFSELAKPLRDCLADLHAARSQGKSRKGPRKMPPAPPLPGDAWPSFWSQEAETSFNNLKTAAVEAVSLRFPDYEGAASGANPIHLYVEACDYGIGGGAFQREKEPHDPTCLYGILGVPRWATKRDVQMAYNSHKKDCKRFEDKRVVPQSVEDAYQVLCDPEKRKAYDSEKGSQRSSSKSLAPLAFHSKSLNATQRGWNTWERELLEVVEFLNAHSSMLTGMYVIIHTDHLNSTLMNAALSYPDKILRMLLKIEAKCNVTWQFLAGCMNHVGDGFSRNPGDRDSVRHLAETKGGLPRTLDEAFKQVLGAREVSPVSVVLPQEEKLESNRSRLESMFENALRNSPSKVAPSVNGVGSHGAVQKHVLVALRPSFVEDEEILDDLSFLGGNDDVLLQSVVTLKPQYVCPMGTCRWLEPYSKPPWNKQVCKLLRNAVYDGVVLCLRTIRDGLLGGVVGYGEGGMIVLSLCSPSLRNAAYAARAVSTEEQYGLESSFKECVSHLVIVAPHGHPLRQYLSFWREAVPESLAIPVLEDKQIILFVPLHDAAREVAVEVASWIQGLCVVEYKFSKPAYRMLPTFLPIDCLEVTPKTERISVPEGEVVPTFFELWSGTCVLSASMLAYGFLCRAFEKDPSGMPGEETHDLGNLNVFSNQALVRRSIEACLVWLVHMSPPCDSWSLLQNLSGSTRTAERPQGDGTKANELAGNKSMAQCLWFMVLCLRFGIVFSFEHPRGARSLLLPLFQFLMNLCDVRVIEYDGCAHGLRPPGWTSSQGDVRIQNPSVLVTNNPYFEIVRKKCSAVGPHKHESVIAWHDRKGPSHTKFTGRYPSNSMSLTRGAP